MSSRLRIFGSIIETKFKAGLRDLAQDLVQVSSYLSSFYLRPRVKDSKTSWFAKPDNAGIEWRFPKILVTPKHLERIHITLYIKKETVPSHFSIQQ